MSMSICVKCSKCKIPYPEMIDNVYPEDVHEDMQDLLLKAQESGWDVKWENGDTTCPECIEKNINNLPEKIEWTYYLHSSKEDNNSVVNEIEDKYGIDLPDNVVEKLIYALYEVSIKVVIDPQTGDYEIISFKE